MAEQTTEKPRILCVNDREETLNLLIATFGKNGWEAVAASNGKEGWGVFQKAKKDGKPFDALITELRMPEMDGMTLRSKIAGSGADIPIFLTTNDTITIEADGTITVSDAHAAKSTIIAPGTFARVFPAATGNPAEIICRMFRRDSILLVGSASYVADRIAARFRDSGYIVAFATDAEDAIAKIELSGDSPTAIVLHAFSKGEMPGGKLANFAEKAVSKTGLIFGIVIGSNAESYETVGAEHLQKKFNVNAGRFEEAIPNVVREINIVINTAVAGQGMKLAPKIKFGDQTPAKSIQPKTRNT